MQPNKPRRGRHGYRGLIFTISLHVFITVAALMTFYQFLHNRTDLFTWLGTAIGDALSLLMPFLVAVVIGYLLSPPVRWLETQFDKIRVFQKLPRFHKQGRLISLLMVYAVLLAFLVLALVHVVPLAVSNLMEFLQQLPLYINILGRMLNELIQNNPSLQHPGIQSFFDSAMSQIQNFGGNAQQFLALLPGLIRQVFSVSTTLFRVMLACVMSFYLLWAKEGLFEGIWSFIDVLIGERRAQKVQQVVADFDNMLSRYIVGRLIESIVVGILCFLGLLVFRTRYNMLLATYYGIMNMIPYLGPVLGLIPLVLITLLDSPEKTLAMVLFLCVLQFFDAYVMAPKVLGDRLGMNPFWVIFAVTVGGALFGALGLFLATPVLAVIIQIVGRFLSARRGRAAVLYDREAEEPEEPPGGGTENL